MPGRETLAQLRLLYQDLQNLSDRTELETTALRAEDARLDARIDTADAGLAGLSNDFVVNRDEVRAELDLLDEADRLARVDLDALGLQVSEGLAGASNDRAAIRDEVADGLAGAAASNAAADAAGIGLTFQLHGEQHESLRLAGEIHRALETRVLNAVRDCAAVGNQITAALRAREAAFDQLRADVDQLTAIVQLMDAHLWETSPYPYPGGGAQPPIDTE